MRAVVLKGSGQRSPGVTLRKARDGEPEQQMIRNSGRFCGSLTLCLCASVVKKGRHKGTKAQRTLPGTLGDGPRALLISYVEKLLPSNGSKSGIFKRVTVYKVVLLFLLALGMLDNILAQKVEEVGIVSMTVSDLDQSTQFFEEVLGFRKSFEAVEQGKALEDLFGMDNVKIKKVHLTIGEEKIELIQFLEPATGRKIPADSKSNDLWFHHIAIVVRDMDLAYKKLRQYGIKHVSTSPQTLPEYIPAAAGIRAFYFRDHDDHNLELIYFPEGKGDPRWRAKSGKLYLGIDHTAFAVGNTPESLSFYRDILGMQVGGQSENYGPEQEHLNQVFGARLLITGLHGDKGIGLEFLNYLAPPGGRPYPADSQPNDLWHWHTELKVNNINSVYQKLQKAGVDFISNQIVDLQKYHFDAQKGFLVRDPNGHALLITE